VNQPIAIKTLSPTNNSIDLQSQKALDLFAPNRSIIRFSTSTIKLTDYKISPKSKIIVHPDKNAIEFVGC
jgi:hypothetical protein